MSESSSAVNNSEGEPVDLASELKRLRQEQGLTQQELADAIGVHQSMIAQLETGRAQGFTVPVLYKLSAVLKVPSDHFQPFFAVDTPESAGETRPAGKLK